MSLCFVLDAHLGGLAASLRMLGYDVLWRNDFGDDELARISLVEGRILLSRDRLLLARKDVGRTLFVQASRTREQLKEVVAHYDLLSESLPFTRCMKCNALLGRIDKERARDRVLPQAHSIFDEFFECPSCRRVYWKGSHYDRMNEVIRELGFTRLA